ncbi:MAG: hypothetical protein FWD69_02965 [Polyangiaceae bacterium]|nr:hypothetical protein [Polyangiaceae bacterium]
MTVPATCDTTQAPTNVSEDNGVFVNAGIDAAAASDGSRNKPFKAIGQALANLSGRSSVFVCASASAYAEAVTLPANVSLYGGFECTSWVYTCERPKVAPDQPGIALNIASSTGTTIADMTFVAKDASLAGDSSIAIFIANSEVALRRVTGVSGNGVAGKKGDVPGSNYSSDTQGIATTTGTGAPAKTCTCQDGTSSTGGAGGNVGNAPIAGAGSASPMPTNASSSAGAGGTGSSNSCTSGGTGASANIGGTGGLGASTLGILSSTYWTPAPGSLGSNGNPGQGGGGGSGGSGGGGGGGCGGCGGSGGLGGQGGGASIAIALYESTLQLDTCTLQTSNAGKGGDGSAGQDGLTGGTGGTGGGCWGGYGGCGSGGGGGGSGAGGISVGVLSSSGSTLHQVTAMAITLGAAGQAGDPGTSGAGGSSQRGTGASGAVGNQGHDGVAQATLQLDR